MKFFRWITAYLLHKTVLEITKINSAFLKKYNLSLAEGAILSVLNQGGFFLRDEIKELLPILGYKKDTFQRKLNKLLNEQFILFEEFSDEEVYKMLKKGDFSEGECHFCGCNDVRLHQSSLSDKK
tara:strand:- start:87 stop:461 length:375 start_codon:yes stop_codon:yes gene_type:complete